MDSNGKTNGQERQKFAASSSDASTSSSNGFCNGKSGVKQHNKQVTSGNGQQRTVCASNQSKQSSNFGAVDRLSGGQQQSTINNGSYSSTLTLELNRPMKIFDMARFKSMLERESRRPCPNRRLLQSQCISIISFVVDDHKMLNLPSWIMIFNIVAIDLLKIELGLIDSNELYLGGPASLSDPSMNRRRFGYHLNEQNRAADSEVSSPPPSTMGGPSSFGCLMARKSHEKRLHNNCAQNQLTASKKAFANAAALGAYNGDHCNTDRQDNKGRLQRYINKFENVARKLDANSLIGLTTDSALEPMHKLGKQEDRRHLLLSGTTDVQQQSSSSSSGFNSHCSSQNNSSTASSSSNIATTMMSAHFEDEAAETDMERAEGGVTSRRNSNNGPPITKGQVGLKESIYKQRLAAVQQSASSATADDELADDGSYRMEAAELVGSTSAKVSQPRGKRPPKLPHRIGALASGRPKMSKPVPIPAPPTSSGAGPSGLANLILVSPTGLSPPLPKRMGHQPIVGGPSKQVSCPKAQTTAPLINSREPNIATGQVPKFSTIKHIDENGHCSVLVGTPDAQQQQQQGQAPKLAQAELPAGIPAHAQLAPPATQRHILRYLMSATRGKLAQINGSQQQQQQHFANGHFPIRYQRPLPIVPSQKMGARKTRAHQEEESLYYCGLQARVSNKLRIGLPAERRVEPMSSSSAINAILTDFRRNSGHDHPKSHLRQHISLTNLHDVMNVQMQSYHHQQQQQQIQSINLSSPKHTSAQSIARPLLKFFKQASSNVSYNNNKSSSKQSSNQQAKDIQTGSMFLSVDNLNQSGQKLNSLSISNLPLKLKRPKTKKTHTKDG